MSDSNDNNNDIDWALQNKLHEEYLANNPDAKYLGWVSI
jgi:hypothetical protein